MVHYQLDDPGSLNRVGPSGRSIVDSVIDVNERYAAIGIILSRAGKGDKAPIVNESIRKRDQSFVPTTIVPTKWLDSNARANTGIQNTFVALRCLFVELFASVGGQARKEASWRELMFV